MYKIQEEANTHIKFQMIKINY